MQDDGGASIHVRYDRSTVTGQHGYQRAEISVVRRADDEQATFTSLDLAPVGGTASSLRPRRHHLSRDTKEGSRSFALRSEPDEACRWTFLNHHLLEGDWLSDKNNMAAEKRKQKLLE